MHESERLTVATGVESLSAESVSPATSWRRDLDPSTRYEHRRELGRGGMGVVGLAFDRGIDRAVAVKRLLGSSSDEVARFVDEARIVGRMEHPNIVPVHDIGIDADGRLFFVMKYVEGDTLRQIIDRLADGDEAYHRRYPFERRMDLFQSLLHALQYAHRNGILHRDVKPENILIGAYGEVMLTDWGIARPLDSVSTQRGVHDEAALHRAAGETAKGSCVGTPPYMSPEQASGAAELDGRSDLYSAFVVFYEMLTLFRYVQPRAKSAELMLVQVIERSLPTLNDSAFMRPGQPAVPAELRHYLRRGLRKPLDERFADAEAALLGLQQVRSGDFMVQCPVTMAKRMGFGLGRLLDTRPLLGLAIAALPALAVLALIVLLIWR